MEAVRFFRGAENHLRRAFDLFSAREERPENLFYCALELRFGVETRYREYLMHQSHVAEKKKEGWQLAVLSRDVEKAFSGCMQEVNVVVHSGGYPVAAFKYTPVTPELNSLASRLGDYLHAPKSGRLVSVEQWSDFESVISRGIELLRYSCSGNLLGVPLRKVNGNSFKINATIDADARAVIDALLASGTQIDFQVSYKDPV